MLGSARCTLDIDYTLEALKEEAEQFQATIEALAMELKLFYFIKNISLPGEADTRHRRVDQFGGLSTSMIRTASP